MLNKISTVSSTTYHPGSKKPKAIHFGMGVASLSEQLTSQQAQSMSHMLRGGLIKRIARFVLLRPAPKVIGENNSVVLTGNDVRRFDRASKHTDTPRQALDIMRQEKPHRHPTFHPFLGGGFLGFNFIRKLY